MGRLSAVALPLLLASSAGAAGLEAGAAGAERAFLETALLARRPAAPLPPVVCSALPMNGVTWPPAMTADDRAALTIALNISGSFEGADGWANLTDNFDGQGVSMGLLNQCLGQGSLQPLLIKLRDSRPDVLTALLGPARLKSLLAMLARWQVDAAGEAVPGPFSRFDQPFEAAILTAPSANKASVAWAVANLYAGGKFTPEWKAELTALASSPEFVSIQIAAAVDDHERALAAEARLGLRELRAYLMLFDVVVQNGSLYPEDLADYDAFARANPAADTAARLENILELRLRHVRPRFVADVRARKRAIIRGAGAVHGSPRDLPGQYCYDGLWPYR